MKKIALILVFCLCLTMFVACDETTKDEKKSDKKPITSPIGTPEEDATEPVTEPTMETEPEDPTEPEEVSMLDPMEVVGTWEFSYSEVEGYITQDGSSTIIISGDSVENLTITFRDHDYPDEDFTDKALILDMRPMYYGCGNENWVLDVDYVGQIGDTTYAITLLEDGTLVKQNMFTIDGMPMVSYQWFVRGE